MTFEWSSPVYDKLVDPDHAALKRMFYRWRLAPLLAMVSDLALDEGVALRRLAMAYETEARRLRRQLEEAK